MGIEAIVVCVEFDDLLRITLPRMCRHFDKVLVVTSPDDAKTVAAVMAMSQSGNLGLWPTNAFYQHGASFNKGAALEQGLDYLGRLDWIAALDADILLPKKASFENLTPGCIYGTTRYVLDDPALWGIDEDSWRELPSPPINHPWMGTRVTLGGHLTVFHAADPVLRVQPWFPTDWCHAGGYDSDFIAKWPVDRQKRLSFPVLHLGPVGQNWYGRITPRLDGIPIGQTTPRKEMLARMHKQRTLHGYTKEKLK